ALLRREVGGLQIGPAEQVFDDLLRAPPAARGPPLVELGRLLLRETQHDVHGPLLVRVLAPLRALLIGHLLPLPRHRSALLTRTLRYARLCTPCGPARSRARPRRSVVSPASSARSAVADTGARHLVVVLVAVRLIKPSPAWWPVGLYKPHGEQSRA